MCMDRTRKISRSPAEVIRAQRSRSRRPEELLATTTVSDQHVTEAAVLASQIEQLPDLQGYLKFASTPEWRRVQLSLAHRRF